MSKDNNARQELAALANRDGITARRVARWMDRFIDALRDMPSVKHACIKAGIDRRAVYRHREKNPEFARRWEEAIERSIDDVEAKVFKMALNGDDQVAASLCTWLLRCHKPERYDPINRSEIAVAGGIIFIPQKFDGAE